MEAAISVLESSDLNLLDLVDCAKLMGEEARVSIGSLNDGQDSEDMKLEQDVDTALLE